MHAQSFSLVKPTATLKESFLQGLREFQTEGLPWDLDLDAAAIEADFDSFVNAEADKTHRYRDHKVLETVLWGVWDGEYAGSISIRHELNDKLRIIGGHIGYDTRPSLRGRGIATLMLKGALPVAKRLGIKQVLLTCDDSNLASIRVIEKNGGILEAKREVEFTRTLKRYYWIAL